MDLKNYVEDKKNNRINLGKVGDAYFISKKQFDVDSGEPKTPQVEAIDLKQVEENITTLQQQIDLLNQLKADLLALDAKPEK